MKEKKIRLEITQTEFAQLYQEAPAESTLKKILDRKVDDMVRRELFSDMMKAPTEEEKETARKMYLDKIGIPESFRW